MQTLTWIGGLFKLMIFFSLVLLRFHHTWVLCALFHFRKRENFSRDTRHNTTPEAKLIFFTASLFDENKKDNYIFIFLLFFTGVLFV